MIFLLYVLFSIFVSVLAVALQVGVVFGAMYLIHHYWEETDFGDFNFQIADKNAYQHMLIKLALVLGVPTLLAHLLRTITTYFFIGRIGYSFPLFMFFIIAGGSFAGLLLILQIKPDKAGVLAGVNLLFYMLLYWIVVGSLVAV